MSSETGVLMVEVEVDVITVTAYKCVHCRGVFSDSDSAFEHLDTCPSRPAKSYIGDMTFGNMILKEGVV